LPIANWLLHIKTVSQLDTLRKHPELDCGKIANLKKAACSKYQFTDIQLLMAEEGRLAIEYFSAFTDYPLKWNKSQSKSLPPHWLKVTERTSLISPNKNGRHATSPYHSLLNYALSLLETQVRRELNIVGLDPAGGYLHSDKLYRDSLVYDLMEAHRATVDHLVLNFIQKNTLQPCDFILMADGHVRLAPQLARLVVASCQVPQHEVEETVRTLVNML